MLDFLNGFPWNPVVYQLRETRETILQELDEQGVTIDAAKLTDVNLLKRHVLKRCIYGVDLNPMAVELAKVSLWLDSFTLGAPLSFLDHHLQCGNSLIGVGVEEVRSDRGERPGERCARRPLAGVALRQPVRRADVGDGFDAPCWRAVGRDSSAGEGVARRVQTRQRPARAVQAHSRRLHVAVVRQQCGEAG